MSRSSVRGRPDHTPGSRCPRLNPDFHSARHPEKNKPLIRETSSNSIKSEIDDYRKYMAMLPNRFYGKDD